jgi:hypothetical protein
MVMLLVNSRKVLIKAMLKFKWLEASLQLVLPNRNTIYAAIRPPKTGISEERNHHVPVLPTGVPLVCKVIVDAFKVVPPLADDSFR